ncbi:TPA: hypothetical protein DEA21_05465 [Candidatus Uhrbacteria bacterium]|nr:hypothetical protein [Candidatus Uhrbacteria bacterium]HCU31785.1 hypothetical protein [Candidatus Uhrbacteria bacterium]
MSLNKYEKPNWHKKRHGNGYNYLFLSPFPSAEFKKEIPQSLIQKSNQAQFLLGKLSGITLLLPDVNYFISSYVMKDAAASVQIEGTKATIIDALEYEADSAFKKVIYLSKLICWKTFYLVILLINLLKRRKIRPKNKFFCEAV